MEVLEGCLCCHLLWTILAISGSYHACVVARDISIEQRKCHDTGYHLQTIASMGIVIGSFGIVLIFINLCLPIMKYIQVPINESKLDKVVLFSNIGCSIIIYFLTIIFWILIIQISHTLQSCGFANSFETIEVMIGIYLWSYILVCCCGIFVCVFSFARTKREHAHGVY
eukprot:180309_1